MEKTGVHVISKNIDFRRKRFSHLKILEKDQVVHVFFLIWKNCQNNIASNTFETKPLNTFSYLISSYKRYIISVMKVTSIRIQEGRN